MDNGDYPFQEHPVITEDEAEELHSRADKIVEKNSRQLRCISCLQPITEGQPLLETTHGPYHDRPFKCVDGRD